MNVFPHEVIRLMAFVQLDSCESVDCERLTEISASEIEAAVTNEFCIERTIEPDSKSDDMLIQIYSVVNVYELI